MFNLNNYKIVTNIPENLQDKYSTLNDLLKLLDVSKDICPQRQIFKEYWFCRDARATNDKLIEVDTAIFRTIMYMEKDGIYHAPVVTKDDIKKCFRKPTVSNSDIDWEQLRQKALQCLAKI